MKMKKLTVCAAVVCLLAALAACGKAGPVLPDPETASEPAADAAGDDTVAIVNGRIVTQEEFEYFVRYNVDVRAESGQQITDWEEEVSDGVTVGDAVKEDALNWFVYAGGIHQQASRLGIELTQEDRTALEEQWDQFTARYDSEQAAEQALEEQHFTKELYRYVLETQYLSDKIFDSLYGKNGSDLSDEECAALTESDGYLMAKHILLLTVKMNDDGTREELSEEEKAEKLNAIREMKSRLDETEEDQRLALFEELMREHSEDTGLEAFPDGYLFQNGDMVEEFYDATLSLEEGEVSDVVQTTYGYHLILRLPVNYDVIPSSYTQYAAYGYDYLTLRYLCADEAFGASARQWMDRVEVQKTELYDDLSVAEMLLEEK